MKKFGSFLAIFAGCIVGNLLADILWSLLFAAPEEDESPFAEEE